jgi:uncharacterized membrane protein YbhN (UPF0104 family)
LHYVAAAIGARAASGVRTPLGETFLAQLSAASANRIVPAGVGGSAVLARYLTRRGGLRVSAALGAVACLAVFGAVADLLALAVLLTVGGWFGLSGGVAELATLARRLAELPHAVASSPMILALIAAVVAGVGAFAGRRLWARRPRVRRSAFWQPLRKLVRRPRALCTLMTASAGTTIVLGLAFAASAMMLPGSHPHASVGALVIGYMLAAGTAAALPIPSGVGAVETTLSAVLISAHVPAAQAIADVLAFRVITFWLPAVAGLGAARQLRRAGAL